MRRIPSDYLRRLRNEVPVLAVIYNLDIPNRLRGSRFSFRCPCCREFRTALSRMGNLGRCFRCAKSFNPIDLVVAERGCSFLEAVQYLENLNT